MNQQERIKYVFRNGSAVLYRLLKLSRRRRLNDQEAVYGLVCLRQIERICKDMLRPVIEIVRLEESSEGVFGVLRIAKEVFCFTLEPQDKLNAPDVSCIPAQQYLCRRHVSPRFGETFKVMDVPGRSDILFHTGNTDDDTKGCVLLGASAGKLKGDRAVLNSGATFKEFLARLDGYDEIHLTIREEY